MIYRSLAAVILLVALIAIPRHAAQADGHREGEADYNRHCSYCHSLTPGFEPVQKTPPKGSELVSKEKTEPGQPEAYFEGSFKRGPHLQGLFTRPPGAVENFPYRFVYETAGATWSEKDLDYYISFHARLDEDTRAHLITFLKNATR